LSDRDARKLESAYIQLLRQWISCISRGSVLAVREKPSKTTVVRTNPRPIRLRSYDQFLFEIHHEFRVVTNQSTRAPSIEPIDYRWVLNDSDGHEILAYHYHPMGSSSIKHPHLHAGSQDRRLAHGKKHLPTGYISLAEIIRCLITEFEAPPLRTDWADILAATPGTIESGSSI
jgi:hypothetical protein